MTPRSQEWMATAMRQGMDSRTAYYGAEVITSWSQFWNYEIPEKGLELMLAFGLSHSEAARHRWGLLAGPRPWSPQDAELEYLKADPRYSAMDTGKTGS